MPPAPIAKVSAWAEHIVHLRAARVFIEACATEGIVVLPVKGIVTAYTLYADPAERPLSDVDVRVRPADYARVGDLARRRGWRIVEAKRAYSNWVLDVHGVSVDVECHIGPPHVCRLAVDEAIARARTSELLGFPSLVPDFVDHAAILVVNLFKDKLVLAREWAQVDLERLAQHPEFDATALATRLREARLATVGWIVADWLAGERGCVRWTDVRVALEPVARPLYVRALSRARQRPEGFSSIMLARAGSDDPLERLRAVATMARWKWDALR